MIPNSKTVVVDDTLPGEEVAFTIGSPEWVMDALADLYSNRHLAVIREYSTNARDAHIMAKGRADVPIDVTLPSMMDPYFRVIDTGVGMSKAVLKERYTSFGDSNKRNSNKSNGMLGFGCKAGIAYTPQFTVTSVYNGMRTVAVISKKSGKGIVLKVVAESKTTDRNGTTVEIPVAQSDIDKFNHIAGDFYKYWMPGTVKVDGAEPVHAVGEQIDVNMYYSLGSASYVVMGNVAYPIANPSALFDGKPVKAMNFVAYVDHLSTRDGAAVEFTPNREALKYSDKTVATLHKVIDDFAAKILSQADKEIKKARTHFEAFKAYTEWADRLGTSAFDVLEFKGDKFDEKFDVSSAKYYQPEKYYGRSVDTINSWPIERMEQTLIITDYGMSVGTPHRERVKEYRSQLRQYRNAMVAENVPGFDVGMDIKYFLFTEDSSIGSKWIPKSHCVSWDDLKTATSNGATARMSTRPKGSWDYLVHDGNKYVTRENGKPIPDDGKPVYYLDTREVKKMGHSTVAKMMDALGHKDGYVIIVPGNRREKFIRENKNIIYLKTAAGKLVVLDGPSLLSDEAKNILSLDANVRQWMELLGPENLDDPVLKATKNLLGKRADTKKYDDNLSLARSFDMWYSVKRFEPERDSDVVAAMRKYEPILSEIYIYNLNVSSRKNLRAEKIAHLIIYMNAYYAIWAAEQSIKKKGIKK